MLVLGNCDFSESLLDHLIMVDLFFMPVKLKSNLLVSKMFLYNLLWAENADNFGFV